MLRARWLIPATLLLTGCDTDKPCDARFVRGVDWDHAPTEVGFSADEFTDAFASEWRAAVIETRPRRPDEIPSLHTMEQGWTWTWRPDRAEAVVHRKLKRWVNRCPIQRLELEQHTLTLPVVFEGWSDDGVWAYSGNGWLTVWQLPELSSLPGAYWNQDLDREVEAGRFTYFDSVHPDLYLESEDILGISDIPRVGFWNNSELYRFSFGLYVWDPGGEFDYREIGGGPVFTLTEPIR